MRFVRSHDGEEAISIAGLPLDLNELLNSRVGRNKGVTTSLGLKEMGGVRADGTQTIATIPAGEIGNGKPIQIISKKLVSAELQTVVYSRNSDPRSGETIYQAGQYPTRGSVRRPVLDPAGLQDNGDAAAAPGTVEVAKRTPRQISAAERQPAQNGQAFFISGHLDRVGTAVVTRNGGGATPALV